MTTTTLPLLTYSAAQLAAPGPLPAPPDGIYVADERIYRRIAADSQSQVKVLIKTGSLADYKHQRDNPRTPTRDMLRGRAGHQYILEPEAYRRGVVTMPTVSRKPKAGQEEWVAAAVAMLPPHQIEEWQERVVDKGWKHYHDEAFALAAEMASRTVVDADWIGQLVTVREAVMGNPICRASIEAPGAFEAAAVATDPQTGRRVKCRIDRLVPGAGHVLDFKFTGDMGPAREPYPGLIRQIRTLRYDIQVEWTEWLLDLLGEKVVMELAFVQWDDTGTRPIDSEHVAVVNLNSEDVDAARKDRERALSQIAEAERTDAWPGFPHHISGLSARPVWDMEA